MQNYAMAKLRAWLLLFRLLVCLTTAVTGYTYLPMAHCGSRLRDSKNQGYYNTMIINKNPRVHERTLALPDDIIFLVMTLSSLWLYFTHIHLLMTLIVWFWLLGSFFFLHTTLKSWEELRDNATVCHPHTTSILWLIKPENVTLVALIING